MRAMILAAGRGERMRPLTDTTPKPLLKVAGTALIVWHITRLSQAGFTDIVINHAYLGEQIEAALGDGREWQVNIQYSPEQQALETAGGIANALPLLQADGHENQPFLVVNGDVFTEVDFSKLGLTKGALAHLVLVNNPVQHPQGDFSLENNLVGDVGDKKLTFSGIGVYHPSLFSSVTRGQAARLAPLLRTAMQSQQVTGSHFQGVWHDIGTPERLEQLNQQLKMRE